MHALKDRFGTAGLVVAIVALVAALGGGAYAASGGLNAKQKKQVKQIAQTEAKKFQGTGPAGPAGPAGPKGDPGASGAAGKDGADGKNGTNGTNGTNGVSVTTSSFTGSKGTCTEEQGGVEVISASPPAFVCNGKDGEDGGGGETLAPGKTETGAFLTSDGPLGTAGAVTFSPSLPAPLDNEHVIFVQEEDILQEEVPEECDNGVAPAPSANNPEADAGYFCAFPGFSGGPADASIINVGLFEAGAATYGAIISKNDGAGGSWAVTAPN